ncbi:DUF7504 family protein [Haladaptatus sp. NG-SE-30]
MTAAIRFREDGDCVTFQPWLRKLKQRGSNILVTGNVPDTVSARAARTLFGRVHRRYRILALIDRTIHDPETRLPDYASVEDSTTWLIDQRHGERSVPAAATAVTSYLNPPQKNDIHQLRDEIQTAISFFEDHDGGLEPAELRVGVDSLFPFVQREMAATKRALRTITATVRGVHGMAHYHLRVSDDDDVVDELDPLFDARIELRKRPGLKPEQRWHAPELDVTTVWVEL